MVFAADIAQPLERSFDGNSAALKPWRPLLDNMTILD
jgi:hypothetical protein